MKIAVITPYYNSKHGGGINTFTVDFVESLKGIPNLNIEIGYMCGVDENNFKLRQGKISSIFSTLFTLKKMNPDIIQVHNDWPLLFGSAIYKIFHKNVTLSYIPLTEPVDPVTLMRKINQQIKSWMFKKSFKRCDYIVIGCEEFWKKFTSHFNLKIENKKTVHIQIAINPQKVIKEEISSFRNKYNISENRVVLVIQAFTASEVKANGIKLMLHILKEMKKKIPNVLLILTREGEYSKTLQEYSKKENVSENAIFTGDLENPIVPLKICDIFLWPWLGKSGFGVALLEAMLEKKAIIATSSSGNLPPLINGKNALIVKPNENAIINAVLKLLKDKELSKKLGENAKKTVLEKYTWDYVKDIYLKLYNIEK